MVSAGLLAWLAWGLDWSQIQEVLAHLRLGYWLGAIGLYILAQIVSARRWQLLAQPLGFKAPLWQVLTFYFIGMFFNLLLPTSVGGDVVRAWYLDGGSGRRLPAFLSVFVDRFSGLVMLLAMSCAAVFFCPSGLPPWIAISVWSTAGCVLLGLLAIPVLVQRTNRFERIGRLLQGVRLYVAKPGLIASTTGLSLFVQAANVMVVWLVGYAITAPVPGNYYWVFVPMVTLLTMLPISLNGMGVREGSMVLFLAPLGVEEGMAVSLAFLWFSVFIAASLVGAGVYLFGRFSRPEEQDGYGLVHHHPNQGRTRQLKAAA
jgi:uncharacterized membrane protein YbhN (UPF0104 family)